MKLKNYILTVLVLVLNSFRISASFDSAEQKGGSGSFDLNVMICDKNPSQKEKEWLKKAADQGHELGSIIWGIFS